MKKLKKILLINWLYFSKELIEVDDINFLTGKNGAGKSTVIDALQIVLLGETNARNFNQAANEKSQRTLDGYLRADMDDNNPNSRRGKDFSSFIVCEFRDDLHGSNFVTGVIFDCRNDGSRQERFFIYDGVIPQDCFVRNGEAIDIPTLRTYLKQYGVRGKLYDSQKQYRTDMLAKWNVHTEQVPRMMKKAVSFRPIVDIQKFITENICDIPEKPDIEAMQQNIRDYKRHELLAQRQEEKLSALQEIAKLYREMQQAIERWQIQSFLVLWAKKEDQEAKILKCENEKSDCEASIQNADKECERISTEIEARELRKEQLREACARSDVLHEENRLRATVQSLQTEQQNLLKQLNHEVLEIKKESVRIGTLCGTVLDWERCDTLKTVLDTAVEARNAFSIFENCTYELFSCPTAIFERAQRATTALSAAVRDSAYDVKTLIDELLGEKDSKLTALERLQKNVKDYPNDLILLKARLSAELEKQYGHPVAIDILADVLEIAESEEQWRGAVEGYLNTQKFYLLVEPKYYSSATSIYNKIKREFGRNSFGLIDIGKMREKEKIDPWEDSLAKKVLTNNDLARSYIDYLLGRVVCCAHVDQLRHHKTAITAEGMLYQGYVVRPIRKQYMDDAFIGRRAITLRIAKTGEELREINAKLERWKPIYQVLDQYQHSDSLFTQYFVNSVIAERQSNYRRGLEISSELQGVAEQLSHLDLFWLDEQRSIIRTLEKEISDLREQEKQHTRDRAQMQERIHQLDFDKLPDLYKVLVDAEDRIADEFTTAFVENIGKPRYQKELQRLKQAPTIFKNFSDRLEQTRNEQETAQKKLFRARYDYVDKFKPCSFAVEVMSNDEYAEEARLLEESELPKYREKIKAAQESAMEQFQNDFLAKLKSSIDQVQDQVKNLNKALKQAQFGTDKYQFRVDRNPDYADYYDMIMAPELMEGDAGLFAMPFQQKYGKLIESLFSQIAMSDDTQVNARKESELQQNIARFTDFRTYLKFDLETTDQNGSKQLLSQTLNTKSGGETQTPFYIAVLASFAQLYQVNNLSGQANNTVRLVVFDEAFNKMDSDRIVESVRLLRKMGLQAIICTPPDKLSDIMPLADKTHLVIKDKYQMHIKSWGKEILPV